MFVHGIFSSLCLYFSHQFITIALFFKLFFQHTAFFCYLILTDISVMKKKKALIQEWNAETPLNIGNDPVFFTTAPPAMKHKPVLIR